MVVGVALVIAYGGSRDAEDEGVGGGDDGVGDAVSR